MNRVIKLNGYIIAILCGIMLLDSTITFAGLFSKKKMYVVAASGLRLRDKESVSGNLLATIPYGAEVEFVSKGKAEKIDDKYNNWYKIKWEKKTGWAFGAFLSEQVPLPNKYNFDTLAGYYEFLFATTSGIKYATYIELFANSDFTMGLADQCYCPILLKGKYSIEDSRIVLTADMLSSYNDSESISPKRITVNITSVNSLSVPTMYNNTRFDNYLSEKVSSMGLDIPGLIEAVDKGKKSITFNRTTQKNYNYNCDACSEE